MTFRPEDNRPCLLIIGGGIAGLSLAYALSRYPLGVTLIEAGRIGEQGASSVPLALLNPYRGRSGRARPEDIAGLKAMWQLVAELQAHGLDPGVYASGVLRVADSAKQAKQWQRLAGVRWLEPPEVPGVYHAPYGAMLIAEGGYLRPPLLLAALRQACVQRGVRVLERCRATALSVPRVITTQGDMIADAVIICSGAEGTLRVAGLPVLEQVAGDVIELASDTRLPYPFAGALYGAQLEERVAIGGNHRTQSEAHDAAHVRLQRAAAWFVPKLHQAAVMARWHGVRLKQANNRPLACELTPGLWYFGALAGRGFLCAYDEAQRLATKLASDVGDSRLRSASSRARWPDDW